MMRLRSMPLMLLALTLTVTTALPVAVAHAPKNLLLNPSFENGGDAWFALQTKSWGGFTVTDRYAGDGRHASQLVLRADPSAEGTRILGVVQEVTAAEFPKRLAGSYRIEAWQRGTPKQYLQAVVVVFDARAKLVPNYQIRYILTGIDRPPFTIRNAQFVFVGAGEPVTSRWLQFDRNLHADFQREWGRVPADFTKIRVLFEVRYDDKKVGESGVSADVYYDALHLGD